MNNAGRVDSEATIEPDESLEGDQPTSGRSRLLLVIFAGVLIASLVIGIQAFGILYSIVFPPAPPLLPDVTEARHTSIDHGVDEWVYQTNLPACDVVEFYEQKGGACAIRVDLCIDDASENVTFGTVGQHVATCTGAVEFSLFAYRWEANIADGYQDMQTQFNLIREVFWTGAVPPRLDPRKGFEFGD